MSQMGSGYVALQGPQTEASRVNPSIRERLKSLLALHKQQAQLASDALLLLDEEPQLEKFQDLVTKLGGVY